MGAARLAFEDVSEVRRFTSDQAFDSYTITEPEQISIKQGLRHFADVRVFVG